MKTTLLLLLVAFTTLNAQAVSLVNGVASSSITTFNTVNNDLLKDGDEKLTILTNPVKDGQLRLKYIANAGVSFNLTIVNSLGEQVFTAKRNASSQELSFDISKLATGIYFLRVSTDDSSVVKKLIVQ